MGRLIKPLILIALTLLSLQGYASDKQDKRYSEKDDQTRALQLREAGKILPLEAILEIARTQIDGDILEVELEQKRDTTDSTFIYELEILDKKGQVWELKIDAQSGDILKREQE